MAMDTTNTNTVSTGVKDGTFPPKFVLRKTGHVRLAYRMFEKDLDSIPHEGHEHDLDHATILIKGKVRVDWKTPEGKTGSRMYDATEGPCHFMVNADIFHTITPLANGTIWLCCFLPHEGYEEDLRDFWNERSLGAIPLYEEAGKPFIEPKGV